MNCFEPKSNPSESGIVARCGPRLKLKQKEETRTENHIFCCYVRVREKEREKREREEIRASFQYLWSSVGQSSSSQERKFIALTRATVGTEKVGFP